MNRGYRLAVSAIVGTLLFTGAPAAIAAPGENSKNTIEQSRVIETSPKSLHFDNMIPSQSKTKTLEIKNVSGKTISITPSLDLSDEYLEFLDWNLQFCDTSEKCVDVNSESEIDLEAEGSETLYITLDLKSNLPPELEGVTLNGGIKVTGKVYPEDPAEEIQIIIPDKETDNDDQLAITGLSPNSLAIMGVGGLLMIVGYVVTRTMNKNRLQDTVTATPNE